MAEIARLKGQKLTKMLSIEWSYHHHGNVSGIPILFLHGFMGHGGIWQTTMEQLPDCLFSVALDLPGHGGTEADLDQLDFNSLADAIIDFVKARFIDPPVLVGYSMGGRVALHTALQHPDYVSALVLESSTAGIESPTERDQRYHQDQLRAERLRENGIRPFLADWYEQALFDSLKRQPGLLETIIQKKMVNSPNSLAEVMVRLSPGRQQPLWDQLGKWQKPTMIIAGELDEKFCDIARRMTSQIDQAELKIIPDAGHIVHLENNKDFVSALNFFLSSHIL